MSTVPPAPSAQPVAGDAVDELLSMGDFPVLAAALEGKQGDALRAELLTALSPAFRNRAARQRVTRLGRLQTGDYDEVVMMMDISKTGVRLRVQKDCPLDINRAGSMRLLVSTSSGYHSLAVQLVRVAAEQEKHLEVAFRFLEPLPSQEILGNLRSLIFEAPGPDDLTTPR
jgi:hypothetical protein